MQADKKINYRKIRWRCMRRGMLELDWLLSRFFEAEFLNLSQADQSLFAAFIETPDSQLYAWLLGDVIPENSDDQRLVKMLRAVDQSSFKK